MRRLHVSRGLAIDCFLERLIFCPLLGLEALLLGVFFSLCLGRETRPESKAEVDAENSQHRTCTGETGLGLCAITYQALVVRHAARFGDVPGRPILRMFRVGSIAAGLIVDGDGIQNDEDSVDEDGEDRRKDMQHVHDRFDQHDEHGEDGNDDIVVGNTIEW